ncbi:MAG: hypothetical protein AAF337_14250, partial [Pseudomonadota bacterium]
VAFGALKVANFRQGSSEVVQVSWVLGVPFDRVFVLSDGFGKVACAEGIVASFFGLYSLLRVY